MPQDEIFATNQEHMENLRRSYFLLKSSLQNHLSKHELDVESTDHACHVPHWLSQMRMLVDRIEEYRAAQGVQENMEIVRNKGQLKLDNMFQKKI